jgi:hypothetical protein
MVRGIFSVAEAKFNNLCALLTGILPIGRIDLFFFQLEPRVQAITPTRRD